MTKVEIKYLLKYLVLMIIPTIFLFYLAELLLSYIFQASTMSSVQELISKSTTLIIIIGLVRLFKKENLSYYTQDNLVSGIYLTFNSAIFLFTIFTILYGIEITSNLFASNSLFQINNILGLAVNFVLITVFTAINLTKNIKLIE